MGCEGRGPELQFWQDGRRCRSGDLPLPGHAGCGVHHCKSRDELDPEIPEERELLLRLPTLRMGETSPCKRDDGAVPEVPSPSKNQASSATTAVSPTTEAILKEGEAWF